MAVHAVDEDRSAPRLDLQRIYSAVVQRWWMIAIIFAVCIGAAVAAYLTMDRVYSSTARMEVNRRLEQIVPSENRNEPVLTTDSAAVDTEVQKLQAPELLAAVVDKLHLERNPEFAGSKTGPAARSAAIGTLGKKKLKVHRDGLSYSIAVTASSQSAKLSADIVNTLIETYTANQVLSKTQGRDSLAGMLDAKLQKLRVDMVQADAAVASYRIRNGIIDATKDSTVRQQEISGLNTQLASSKADQAVAQSQLSTARSQLQRGRSTEALGESLKSPVVADLRRQQAELSVQAADLSNRYGPLHPDVKRINSQLAEINSRIQSEVSRIVSSLESEAMVANGRTASLQSSVAGAEGAVMRQTAASVELDHLQQNADSAKALYQAFLDQYRAAVAQTGTDKSAATISSRGQVPIQPEWPSAIVLLLAALVLATIISAALVLALELFRSGLENGDDVKRVLGVGTVGSIPDLTTIPKSGITRRNPVSPSDYMLNNPGSAYAESIRTLRTGLQMTSGGRASNVVAITSALPDEGKTTLAMSLARSAAHAGQRVLLVDTDLRRRASSRSMADGVKQGLVEVLNGTVAVKDALIKDSVSGAFLLPQAVADIDKYDAISPASLEKLLSQVRGSFDLIILDSAPILPVAESRIVASAADVALVAVRWRDTPAKATESALAHLERAGAKIGGVVLTLVDLKKQARAGSGDEAFYSRYKSYYS